MSTKDEYDLFAAEMARRFEDFVSWSMEHWPNKQVPLVDSDFAVARKEISEMVGPRLGDGQRRMPDEDAAAAPSDDGAQYVQVTPMPWP